MDKEFHHEDFREALKPENWIEEQILHTPTFDAHVKVDGTLYLHGPALREGFSVEAVQDLTRFLSEHVSLPLLEPPHDFSDVTPRRVDLDNEGIEPKE